MIRILADPDIEQALVALLNEHPLQVGAQPVRLVVIQQTTGADIAQPAGTQPPATTATAPAGPRLTLQDYVINVLTRAERPLTTKEVYEQVRTLRGDDTNHNSIYNTLRNARTHKLVKYDGEHWASAAARS